MLDLSNETVIHVNRFTLLLNEIVATEIATFEEREQFSNTKKMKKKNYNNKNQIESS